MAHPIDPKDPTNPTTETSPEDEPTPIAVLSAEQMQLYSDVIAAQKDGLAETALVETALRRRRIVDQAIARERARLWVRICNALGMDPKGGYTLDDASQVFAANAADEVGDTR